MPPFGSDSFDLFLDEAGNTGGNFIDSEQPIFAYAGWVICHKDLPSVEAIVAQVSRTLPGFRTELKGNRLLRNPRGRAAVESLLDELRASPALIEPVLSIWEKRFALAIEISYTILNPEVVPDLGADFDSDRDLLRRTANELYCLSDQVLASTWRAIRSRDIGEVKERIVQLETALYAEGFRELAAHFARARPYVADAIDLQVKTIDEDRLWRGLKGLHVQSLIGVLNDVELIGRRGLAKVAIYHDDTRQFRDVLAAALKLKQTELPLDVRISSDAVIRRGYTSFDEIKFVRSENHPALQAADVLAALVATELRTPQQLAKAEDTLSDKTRALIGLSTQPGNAVTLVISERFARSLEGPA